MLYMRLFLLQIQCNAISARWLVICYKLFEMYSRKDIVAKPYMPRDVLMGAPDKLFSLVQLVMAVNYIRSGLDVNVVHVDTRIIK